MHMLLLALPNVTDDLITAIIGALRWLIDYLPQSQPMHMGVPAGMHAVYDGVIQPVMWVIGAVVNPAILVGWFATIILMRSGQVILKAVEAIITFIPGM